MTGEAAEVFQEGELETLVASKKPRPASKRQVADLALADRALAGRALADQHWWRRVDSNHGPTDYETVALAT